MIFASASMRLLLIKPESSNGFDGLSSRVLPEVGRIETWWIVWSCSRGVVGLYD